jgi:GNAT superfamily N-acetyltransferase
MVILPAEFQDAGEILALQHLAYQSEAALYDDYTIPPLRETLEQPQDDIRREIVLKAVPDDRIVGSIRGVLVKETCHIARLIVHPDFQNQGVGTRLMQAIEAHFNMAGKYELFTGERSERNLYLYGKLGYPVIWKQPQTEKVNLVFLEKTGLAYKGEEEKSR